MDYNLMLTWMSERGSGSWQQFREGHAWLETSSGQQAGDELSRQLLEGVMNVHFQIREASRILGQLLKPGFLLRTQLAGELVDHLTGWRHGSAILAFDADFHSRFHVGRTG